MEEKFLENLEQVIEEHIREESFGVSELADAVNMSRSNLLRRVKKLTKLSASQFIRQVRLKKAMDMLRQTSLNVSEVSYKVGFGSTSYFIKCFREYYGYSPGEVGKRESSSAEPQLVRQPKKGRNLIIGMVVTIIALAVLGYTFLRPTGEEKPLEKSIAVLPFKNDSNDSTNIYLINGLMESTLNNLQKIKDLRVISRTTVEKYRNANKSIPEISKELGVSYFVEGSGQKIGNQILLNIQLISADDRHLWAQQYRRESSDIFKLQQEIAQNIVEEVEVFVTPEEKEQIEKLPTENLQAYDVFLKGQDLVNQGEYGNNLQRSLPYLKEAIELDPKFGLAHAYLAIAYFYLDRFQVEKKYLDELNSHSDKAVLYEPEAIQTLMAKAFSFMQVQEYEQAVPYLERALEYNPNSAWVVNTLSDLYTTYIPNTSKYLEYALRGIKMKLAAEDSVTKSYLYLHLSNALIQTGFVDEALQTINTSLDYFPENPYGYIKAFIQLAKDGDLEKAREQLVAALENDSTRIDIIQEIGKVSFYMRDYETAYHYYKRFNRIRAERQIEVYPQEDLKIGMVFSEMGEVEKGKEFIENYQVFAHENQSIYQHLIIAAYEAYVGNDQKALHHIELFTEEDNYQYWLILFLDKDPAFDNLAGDPKFEKLLDKIEEKFWEKHNEIRATLEEKRLL